MSSSSGHYQQIKVSFTGDQKDYIKYKIRLHAVLGIEGLVETLEPVFNKKFPTRDEDVFGIGSFI